MSMSIVRLRYSHFGHAHWALSAVWVRRWNSIIGAWVQVTHRHKQTTTTITCPVHTVPCISSALTCNCKVGKHMRHKQFSSQSADRWPTGPKLVHTILYEYCMYGLTYILCFCGLCQFMTQNNVVKAERHWTLLKARIRLTPKGSCQIESFLPNLLVYQMKEQKQKSFIMLYFFKNSKSFAF